MGLFSKSKSSEPTVYGLTANFTNLEDMSEDALRWTTLARKITDPLARDWFEDLSLVPLVESIKPRTVNEAFFNLITPFGVKDGGDSEPAQVMPHLVKEAKEFGEALDIEKTELGLKLVKVLKDAGISWEYQSHGAMLNGEQIHFEDKTTGVAVWPSAFGFPVLQNFQIYIKDGTEFCYWSSPQLLATRPFEHIAVWELRNDEDLDSPFLATSENENPGSGELTIGEWPLHFYVPMLAQSLFYLAETPFPSGMMSLSRALAYRELANEALPTPRLRIRRDAEVIGITPTGPDSPGVYGGNFPIVVDFGWEFSTKDEDEILTILQTATNGLVKISTYLEDGFFYHVDPTSSYSWDWALLSASIFTTDYVEGESHLGFSHWIPSAFAGAIYWDARNVHSRLDNSKEKDAESLALALAFEYPGYSGAAGINTLIFRYATQNLENNEPLANHLLDTAVRMTVPNESTNALANWGIYKFKLGKFDEAAEKFEAALNREDKYAEAEASYYLAEIYRAQGRNDLAVSYATRCEAAGGYTP